MFRFMEKPELYNTILIEGLPGIGLVGKLAAEHMLDELHATKFAELYSPNLPPQVSIKENGVIEPVKMDFYYYKRKDDTLVILVGDFQGITPESQYQISEKIINTMERFDLKRVYTLGGLGTGSLTKTPKVYGAATHPRLVKELKKYGVIFKGGGAIFGASGLLLAISQLKGIEGVCLMGETHGQIIDARSAEAVLQVLTKIINQPLDMTKLEEKAKETEAQMAKISKMIAAYEATQKQQAEMVKDIPTYIR